MCHRRDPYNFDILYKFFEGQASLREEEQIKKWLDSSDENRNILLRARELFDASILYGNEDACLSNTQPVRHKKRKIWTEFSKIGVAVVVTILSGLWYLHLTEKEESGMQTISVPAGQHINITLPDGSNVWLNARTTIQYPISFGKKERLVKLDGEAYFDVTKNENCPFIVETPKSKLEVLGTTFNVISYSNNNTYEVALIEGSVKVNIGNEALTLAPQHKINIEDEKIKVTLIDDYNLYRWKEGLICFNKESFDEIIRKLEKSYDVKLIIQNTKIKDVLYTGKFRLTDGVDYALRVLQKDIKFKYDRDDENHIIYIR
ncbi:MAG: FecR family protein [Dysgonomonas sp.]